MRCTQIGFSKLILLINISVALALLSTSLITFAISYVFCADTESSNSHLQASYEWDTFFFWWLHLYSGAGENVNTDKVSHIDLIRSAKGKLGNDKPIRCLVLTSVGSLKESRSEFQLPVEVVFNMQKAYYVPVTFLGGT